MFSMNYVVSQSESLFGSSRLYEDTIKIKSLIFVLDQELFICLVFNTK